MINRVFTLGDEWFYVKVYTGFFTADEILINVFKPLFSKLIKEAKASKFFFIRYYDDEFHLRIRIKLSNNYESISYVINEINKNLKPYLDNHIVWKIQTDTYTRELERYGVRTIETSESLFMNDSKMVLDFLSYINKNDNKDTIKWLFALRHIDEILSDFNLNLANKIIYIKNISISFEEEFNLKGRTRKSINKKYKINFSQIKAWMLNEDKSDLLSNFESEYQMFSQERQEYISTLINNDLLDKEAIHLYDYISSIIHMFLNRLFRTQNRLNEAICYYYLKNFYNFLHFTNK